MRKSEHQAVVAGLKARITALEEQRDVLLKELHGKADAATAAIGKLGDDLSGLGQSVRNDLKAHGAALGKHGKTVTDHIAAVQQMTAAVAAAVKPAEAAAEPEAAPGPETPPAVTSIKSRSSKAAG